MHLSIAICKTITTRSFTLLISWVCRHCEHPQEHPQLPKKIRVIACIWYAPNKTICLCSGCVELSLDMSAASPAKSSWLSLKLLLLHLFVQTYAVYSSTHAYIHKYIHIYIYTHNLEALDASCPKAIEVGIDRHGILWQSVEVPRNRRLSIISCATNWALMMTQEKIMVVCVKQRKLHQK